MIVGRNILIDNDELSEREWERLFKALTFVNGNDEIVECYRHIYTRNQVAIPRGAWDLVSQLDYVDKRVAPIVPTLKFELELDDIEKDERFVGQQQAVDAMFENAQGQIIRPPGTGKSQIALAFIAQCQTSVLVIVHTEDILQQWIRYAEEAIPDCDVGVIRGSEKEVGQLTIGTIQTLRDFTDPEFWSQFGAIIADEAHHGAAPSWETTLGRCPAHFRFGFTASPTRADGMHPALKFIFGPIIHEQKFSSPVKIKVVPVRSSFNFRYRGSFDWMPMLNKLVQDDKRNQLIAEVVNDEVRAGNTCLILSRRIEHLERLASRIEPRCEILTGIRKSSDRKQILADFREGKVSVVLATQLADEALDVPRLNRIVLTHPGKHEGRLIQQIGRALRESPGKIDVVIYDVADVRVGVLRHQWSQRKHTYKKLGIHITKWGRA